MKDQVKQATDLLALIAEYTTVDRFHKACCPLHTDKTPSLSISVPKQLWHCFSCRKGGDCFTFYQEIMGCDFKTALHELAKRAGIPINGDYTLPNRRTDKKRIKEYLDRFFDLEDSYMEFLLYMRKEINKKNRIDWDSTDYLIEQLITHKMKVFEEGRT